MTTLFGYPATLVLEDSLGEFTVRDGLVYRDASSSLPYIGINMERVADAVTAREKATAPRPIQKRPVY